MSAKRTPNLNREAVVGELSDILEDSFKTHSLNVGIIGCGAVGKEIASELYSNGKFDRGKVSKIYLFSSDPPKAYGFRDELTKNPGEVNSVEAYHTDKLGKLVNNLDISIICSGRRLVSQSGNAFRYRDLLINPAAKEGFCENMAIVRDLAHAHRDGGFDGLSVIVTNLPDLLAYHFAAHAEVNPLQVVGMNHLDTRRFRTSALQEFSKSYKHNSGRPCPIDIAEVDGIVIGPHDENLFSALPSNLRFGKFPIIDFLIYSEELEKKIVDMRELVNEALKRLGGTTAPDVAKATTDVVRAIANEENIAGVSTYIDTDLEGRSIEPIYLGWPVRFEGFTARRQDLKYDLWDGEAEGFSKAYDVLKRIAIEFGVGGRLREPVESYSQIDKILDESGKELLGERIDEFVERGFSRFFERKEISLEEELDSLCSQYPSPFYRRKREVETGVPLLLPTSFERTYFKRVKRFNEAKDGDLLSVDFGIDDAERAKFFSVKVLKSGDGKIYLEETTNDEYYAKHRGDFERWR